MTNANTVSITVDLDLSDLEQAGVSTEQAFAKVSSAVERAVKRSLKELARIPEGAREAADKAAVAAEKAAAKAERAARRMAEEAARAARAAAREFEQMRDRMANAVTSLGKHLSVAVTVPLVAMATAAVHAATKMDSLERGLVAVEGSSDKAGEKLRELREVARLPGLGFEEAVRGYINLRAVELSSTLATRSLKAFGNALATVGKGKADLAGVELALTQIVSKGKVSAEEINQLAERVPQIRRAMVSAFGTADTEILQKKKIGPEQFIEKVVAELEKLPPVTGGAQNAFENLQDAATIALSKIGKTLLRFLVPALEKGSELLERFAAWWERLPEGMQSAIAITGAIVAALGPLLVILGTLASSVLSLIGLFGLGAGGAGLTAALSALGSVIGPVLAVLAALAAVAAAVYLAWQNNFGGIRELTAQVVGFIQERWQALADWWREIQPMVLQIAETVWKKISELIGFYSDNVKAVILPTWEFISTTLREVWSLLGEEIKFLLQLLTGRWQEASETAQRITTKTWNAILSIVAQAIASLLETVRGLLDSLLRFAGLASSNGETLGRSIGQGIIDGLNLMMPGIGTAIESAVNWARNRTKQESERRAREQAEAEARQSRNNMWAAHDWFKSHTGDNGHKNPPPPPPGIKNGRHGSENSLRSAELALKKSEVEQSYQLQSDNLKRELEIFKENYDERLTVISDYFARRKQLELDQIGLEQQRLEREKSAVEERLKKAKEGSAEYLRAKAEQTDLTTKLELLERQRGDVERHNAKEEEDALKRRSQLLKQLDEQQKKRAADERAQTAARLRLETDGAFARFNREREAIQQKINEGVLSEREARAAVLELELKNKAVLEATLRREMVAAQQAGDPTRVRELQDQIAALEKFGVDFDDLEHQQRRASAATRDAIRTDYERIADAQIYHADRAQQRILDHLAQQKTISESVADAQINLYESVAQKFDGAIDRMTSKMGIFGSFVSEILKGIIRQLLTRIFMQGTLGGFLGGFGGGGTGMFSTGGFAGGTVSFGGSSPGSGLSIGSIFKGIGSGLGRLFGLGSSSSGVVTPVASSVASTTSIIPGIATSGAGSLLHEGMQAAMGASGSAGFFKSAFGGAALPLMGFSLGSMLGGPSMAGSLLSGAGAALGGLVLGASTGLIGGSAGSLFALSGALGPLALAAAPLMILGGWLLGKAKQRRADEKLADSYWSDAGHKIEQLTRDVKLDRVDGAEALAQATALRQEAINNIMQIKTKSVRESRLAHQIPDLDRVWMEPLKAAVADQEKRRDRDSKLKPSFASGGSVWERVRGRMPGRYDGIDEFAINVDGAEDIINPLQRMLLGGREAMRQAGVPGYSTGQYAVPLAGTGADAGAIELHVDGLVIELGTTTQDRLLDRTLSSDRGRQKLGRAIRVIAANQQL